MGNRRVERYVFTTLETTKAHATRKPLKFMVRLERFELPAFWFVARRSIQLSYSRTNRTRILGGPTPCRPYRRAAFFTP
jgi:hypothetical protein